jgi:DNA-binding beta-propeller fold protein YncE
MKKWLGVTVLGAVCGCILALLAVAGLVGTAHAGTLFVADYSAGNGSVNRFDATTGAYIDQLSVPGGMGFPGGLTIGPGGNLYSVDQDGGVVNRFNGTTGAFIGQFVGPGGGLSSPSGLAFGPDGNLYVANYVANGYVNRYNGVTGAFIDQVIPPGFGSFVGGLYYPSGMLFGPDGKLYIADQSNGSVDRFDGSTLVQFTLPGSNIGNLSGLAFGPDGNLYVTDITQSVVHRFDATTGAFIDEFVPSSSVLVQPIGLEFGPDGNLYVTDGQGRVAAFNGTTGAYLGDFIPIGGNLIDPQFLAFGPSKTSVPEPSTLLLLGFSLVGLAGVRRMSI